MKRPLRLVSNVTAEVFDDYESIVNRCMLTDLLNEAFAKLDEISLDSKQLNKALKLLAASKISAISTDKKIDFVPLSNGRINGKTAVFEIIEYSPPDHLNKWFYGRASVNALTYEGKFFIKKINHPAECLVIGVEDE